MVNLNSASEMEETRHRVGSPVCDTRHPDNIKMLFNRSAERIFICFNIKDRKATAHYAAEEDFGSHGCHLCQGKLLSKKKFQSCNTIIF